EGTGDGILGADAAADLLRRLRIKVARPLKLELLEDRLQLLALDDLDLRHHGEIRHHHVGEPLAEIIEIRIANIVVEVKNNHRADGPGDGGNREAEQDDAEKERATHEAHLNRIRSAGLRSTAPPRRPRCAPTGS